MLASTTYALGALLAFVVALVVMVAREPSKGTPEAEKRRRDALGE